MIISTKIMPPLDTGDLVERPRLEDQCQEVCRARLTIVQAPAGYGKTTLLLRWRDRMQRIGLQPSWLTLDSHDQDAVAVIQYVIAAMSTRIPELEKHMGPLMRPSRFTSPDALVGHVVAQLSRDPVELHLFLDDLHLVGESGARALSRLIDVAPANLHFIVSSRETPPFALARLRAKGQLFEIGVQDLLFSVDESMRFMRDTAGVLLSGDEVSAVCAKMEGWVTGLRLAGIAMRRGVSPRRYIESLSGQKRAIADFFAEDVFADLSRELRDFLVATSILERLNPELCDAVIGDATSRTRLDEIEAAGLFLVSLDEVRHWYRFHTLFVDFLRRELAKSTHLDARLLHRRASEWYEQAGSVAEALAHAAKSGDSAWLAALLERHSESLTYTGRILAVAEYAEQLPESVLEQCPMVLLTLAWLRTRNLRFDDVNRLLDLVRRRLETMERDGNTTPGAIERCRLLLLHREMTLAAAEDDMPRVEQQCTTLIRRIGREKSFISCTLYGQLIAARMGQFELRNLQELEAAARSVLQDAGHRFAAVSLESIIGYAQFAAGKVDIAMQALNSGLREGVRVGGAGSGFAAIPALPLSEVLYERNMLDRAAGLVETYLPVAREFGFIDQLISGYVVQPRLLAAAGDLEGAWSALEAASSQFAGLRLERFHLSLRAEQLRLATMRGDPGLAREVLCAMALPASMNDVLPRDDSTTRDEVRAGAWVRFAMCQGNHRDALAVARRWRAFCASRAAVRALIRWQLLVSQILAAEGSSEAAHRALRDTVVLASQGGFVRSFVDAGPVVLAMMSRAYGQGPAEESREMHFAADVLRAAGLQHRPVEVDRTGIATVVAAIASNLSSRELEIVSLVGAGMRNREIGSRLGLTEGSVKWYMQQIFDKVGIRRRSQVVEFARQAGLLR